MCIGLLSVLNSIALLDGSNNKLQFNLGDIYLVYDALREWTFLGASLCRHSRKIEYHIVASRSMSWLVTPHVTNWIWIQLVTWAPKNKSCPNLLTFCEDSWNPTSIRCWKFQFSIFKNKKKLFLKIIAC